MIQIQENISLKPYNSFGIHALAKSFCSVSSIIEMQELLEWNKIQNNPLLILGGGSNLLFTKDYNGLVLQNALKGIELIREDHENYYVKAMAGENWHQFVCYCVQMQYQGIENMSLIPGNVGASPMQNIGAYGVEIKDVFESLEAIQISDGAVVTFNNSACEFGYRESIFKRLLRNQFIILSVVFKLRKTPVYNTSYGNIEQELINMKEQQPNIQSIAEAVIRIRQRKLPDPSKIGNAGSFFKNPIILTALYEELKKENKNIPGFAVNNGDYTKVPAAWLIEQTGWKGFRVGDAGCYPLQPLVLVNYGNATGAEIFDLSAQIIKKVQAHFGILLEREVNIY
ncbi:UDP-N-acetylmuramate dehydrogenase [Sediminibacterium sp.]|uniref:UDP-N-acetylmuramate dehydrogenase n=1 Tax=Sediminibacterium sp. TaxID=1917865 RepID=UPI002736BE6B|nr:UDP-N-acetylmuramate dehydrogenase [Sediminibacterium sp.]MDP3392788.1 UDP-N-acetylmuramate dehydrogenase [Sediminibacterium sp.]MDP3565910.1 UDP-N-acetylmuramate dehydrogenase [Sediminibacterium sp.]